MASATARSGPAHHRQDRHRAADRARHRHALLPAGRAERCLLRRPVRRDQPPAADPYPPRAGRRLSGARRGHGHRQAVRLLRGAGPGLSQHHGGLVAGLRQQRAGAGDLRPGAARLRQPRHRLPARHPRSARHHAAADQVVGPHLRAARGRGAHRRGVPADGGRAAAPGGDRMPARRVGQGAASMALPGLPAPLPAPEPDDDAIEAAAKMPWARPSVR